MPEASGKIPVLIVREGSRHCALPVSAVIETMRPLPVEPVGELPAFILGLSVIRGAPVPVLDLGRLLGLEGGRRAISRFVSLRVDGKRRAAMAVEAVLELRHLDASVFDLMPGLPVGGNHPLDGVGVLDSKLLLLLRTSRIIPQEAWEEMGKALR